MPDLVASLVLLGLLVIFAIAHAGAAAVYGVSRFARVDAAGSSLFLGPAPMHAAYWVLSPVGRALARLGVSANAVTLASLGMGAGAGAALAFGHFGIAGMLAALCAAGDALDGIVARETHTASPAGEILDAVVDRYGEFFFLGGLGIFYHDRVELLALVLFALLGSFMVSYASAKAEALSVVAPRGSMRRAERAVYLTLGATLVPPISAFNAHYASVPMVSALVMVAVVANMSAAYRLERIADLAGERERVPVSEKRPVASSPKAADDGRPPLSSAVR